MQDHIKYLVVEDRPDWSNALNQEVAGYFSDVRGLSKQRIKSVTAYDGDQANEQLRDGAFDLVTLDMNLGASASGSKISGLDVLAQIARNNSAYFVIIITGAVTDKKLENVYDPETAALIRYGALNEAVKLLSAERVRILNKPGDAKATDAIDKIRSQLHSALDQYCTVSLERNIFRPLPGNPDLWEVRYNGGARMHIPHAEPYQMIRSALAQPGKALPVIQLMNAIAQSSGQNEAIVPKEKTEKSVSPSQRPIDYKGHQQDEVSSADGLDFTDMSGFSTADHTPVDYDGGTTNLETLIGGLLRANQQQLNVKDILAQYAEAFGEEVLLKIPGKALEWAAKGEIADTQFGREDVSSSLASLAAQLRPLLVPIRERWLSEKQYLVKSPQKKAKAGGKIHVAHAVDTDEMKLARAHWRRFKEYIGRRSNLEAKFHKHDLKDFLEHVLKWIPRDPTTRGHLHYRPPTSTDLYPFWLTE